MNHDFAVRKKEMHVGKSRITVKLLLRSTAASAASLSMHCSSIHQFLSGAEIIFRSCFEFEKRTATQLDSTTNSFKMANLPRHSVLQEQAKALRNLRGDDGKVMQWH